VHTTDHFVRVQEPKCVRVSLRKNFKAEQPFLLEPAMPSAIQFIAPDPQKFHGFRFGIGARSCVHDVSVEDSDNLSIGKWMGLVSVRREVYDVQVSPWVEAVLTGPDVIARIIDSQDFMAIDAVVLYCQLEPFRGSELVAISEPLGVRKTAQQVLLKLWKEVLVSAGRQRTIQLIIMDIPWLSEKSHSALIGVELV
jgi:hypothetical protein